MGLSLEEALSAITSTLRSRSIGGREVGLLEVGLPRRSRAAALAASPRSRFGWACRPSRSGSEERPRRGERRTNRLAQGEPGPTTWKTGSLIRSLSVLRRAMRADSTGVCCSSGWPISGWSPAVEEDLASSHGFGGARVLPGRPEGPAEAGVFDSLEGPPHSARVVLRVVRDGDGPRCVFLEAAIRACACPPAPGTGSTGRRLSSLPAGRTLTDPQWASRSRSPTTARPPRECSSATTAPRHRRGPAGLPGRLAVGGARRAGGAPPSPPRCPHGLAEPRALGALLRVDLRRRGEERGGRAGPPRDSGRGGSPVDAGAGGVRGVLRGGGRARGGEGKGEGQGRALPGVLRNGRGYPRDPAGWGSRGWRNRRGRVVPHRALLRGAGGLGGADAGGWGRRGRRSAGPSVAGSRRRRSRAGSCCRARACARPSSACASASASFGPKPRAAGQKPVAWFSTTTC